MASSAPATPDTLVTLKVNFQGSTRRFKLPLRDLGASSLEDKVRHAIYQRPRHLHCRFRLIVPTPQTPSPSATSNAGHQYGTDQNGIWSPVAIQSFNKRNSCKLTVPLRSEPAYVSPLEPTPPLNGTPTLLLPTSYSTTATSPFGSSSTVLPRRSKSSSSE